MDQEPLIDVGVGNQDFLEALYELYEKDSSALDAAWREEFDLFGTPRKVAERKVSEGYVATELAKRDARIDRLIEAYRTYGRLKAATNPLYTNQEDPWQLDLKRFEFDEADLDRSFAMPPNDEMMPLRQIIAYLEKIYAGQIGYEYMGLGSLEREQWLQERIEAHHLKQTFTPTQKKDILHNLSKAELLETFLHTKYVGQKRFSIEGGETLIPMLAQLIEKGAELGVADFVLGMAHRGRLNVLAHILNKSYAQIFFEFHENYIPESFEYSWDVKYHKGFFAETLIANSHKVTITLTPNPSHLEAVNAVVEGQAYAKQILLGNEHNGQKSVLPILIHGDAAFTGQGVVYETMQLSAVQGYGCGGTIHIIINNQIGFTTLPNEYASMDCCTNIAKAFGFPVFHVNAEDPEGAVFAINLALETRQKFGCDVLVDLVCYRKYGHNESDEPAFTQPLKYQLIAQKKSIRQLYQAQLLAEGVVTEAEVEASAQALKKTLQEAFEGVDAQKQRATLLPSQEEFNFQHLQTGVPLPVLEAIAESATHIPSSFSIHPKLARLLKERLSMVKSQGNLPLKPIDWGMAELLAFGSLLSEGRRVRLSGQDSCRGTFSHRHAALVDQKNGAVYFPLNHLKAGQGYFEVLNSPLSEYAVLGFELGVSIANLDALVLWEAQFGDFCNGAQVIIDQFISTGEQKWGQQAGLVLLLPHGYEGQGPEHSSGRMERFLTLSGQNNLQVANPSTPAQYFHLLRRQARLQQKKPLVIFTPKSLLRHPSCCSSIEEFVLGSFQEVLDDPGAPSHVTTVVLCSGHIYYDLVAERERLQCANMAIIRLEQLYPLHVDRIMELLSKYSTAKELFWVQEEPKNMGAGDYIAMRLAPMLSENISFHSIGRPRSASPAVGSHLIHKKQLAQIFEDLFGKRAPSIFEIAGKGKPNATGN